jgi:hypothetical protein
MEAIGWSAGLLVAPAEEHREVGQGRDGTGHGGRDGRDQDVPVLHVGQFVGHHAAQLALAEHLQDAGGGRDGGVLGVAAGGEGVGLVFVDDVNLGHRQLGPAGQLAHHVVEVGRAGFVHLLRVVHAQHHLVGEPVGEDVHRAAEDQREEHPGLPADHGADRPEEGDDSGHQDRGLEPVAEHCVYPSFRVNAESEV